MTTENQIKAAIALLRARGYSVTLPKADEWITVIDLWRKHGRNRHPRSVPRPAPPPAVPQFPAARRRERSNDYAAANPGTSRLFAPTQPTRKKTEMIYQFTTFQQLFDRVPSEKIELCLREIGISLAQAKATGELLYETAKALAERDGKPFPERPESLFVLPDPLEWHDDGKGKIETTLSGFSNGESIVISNQPT
jgi:hypothetical protein